jgi:hypothetical protein
MIKTAEEKKQYRRQQYLKHREKTLKQYAEYRNKNRELIREKQKKFNKENPIKRKNSILKYQYGITLNDYNKMFEQQKGKCAICKRHQNDLTRTLCVDHDHKTNQVRALLCVTCNTDVSVVENRLKEMLTYLNKYRKDVN